MTPDDREEIQPAAPPQAGWMAQALAEMEHRDPATTESASADNVEEEMVVGRRQHCRLPIGAPVPAISPAAHRYLVSLRMCPSPWMAAQRAGVRTNQLSVWRDSEEFRRLEAEAGMECGHALLAAAYQRATYGVIKPVFQMGTCVGYVREYSDKLAEVLLKGLLPKMFRPEPQEQIRERVLLGTPEQVAEVVRRLSPTSQPALPAGG